MTKNPLLIAAVGFVLAAFAFYTFALKPKHKQASDTQAKIADAQSRLDSAQALLASNQAARKNFRSAYSTVVRLGKAVPGDDDVRSLVVQLDHAAKRTHVDFQGISVGGAAGTTATTATDTTGSASTLPPGASVGPAGFPVMPFSFTFHGGFFRLGKFFRRIDRLVQSEKQVRVSGRLLTIDGVKLEPAASGFPEIKATVQATSYLVSPLEGPTGGATASGPTDSAASSGDTAPATPAAPNVTTTATIR